MADNFIGEIRMVGFNYAPPGWALCDGQTMSIASNTALFSLLGTMYGGDGVSTFKLPDLRGRVPVSFGQSPGTSLYNQGQMLGTEGTNLTTAQLPAHNHAIDSINASVSPLASTGSGTTDEPGPIRYRPRLPAVSMRWKHTAPRRTPVCNRHQSAWMATQTQRATVTLSTCASR